MELVANEYNIGKFAKHDSRYFGKLVAPRVYETDDGKYFLKATAYRPNCDVALLDYHTSDFYLFETKQLAINAWVGRKPRGTNWAH